MLTSFETLPPSARVWIYQADRILTQQEVETISTYLQNEVAQWAAHGSPLVGAFAVLYNRFVIVAVDEAQNAASGCSIDASTRWLKALGEHLQLNFFDRSVSYWKNQSIASVEMLQLKQEVALGNITPDTVIFNNLVATKGDFETQWQLKAADSWMKRYFKGITA